MVGVPRSWYAELPEGHKDGQEPSRLLANKETTLRGVVDLSRSMRTSGRLPPRVCEFVILYIVRRQSARLSGRPVRSCPNSLMSVMRTGIRCPAARSGAFPRWRLLHLSLAEAIDDESIDDMRWDATGNISMQHSWWNSRCWSALWHGKQTRHRI